MVDVECYECGWKGNYKELITFVQGIIELCPICGEPDSIGELDGVSEDDYRNQEPREKIE
jgi:hypothetical protein